MEHAINWLYQIPSIAAQDMPEYLEQIFSSVDGNMDESMAEMLGWATQIETFSYEMAQSITTANTLPQERESNLDLAHAIQRRSRDMICNLALYAESSPDISLLEPRQLRYFQHGIKAHLALINLMANKGIEGLAEQIHLPDFIFKQYRNVPIGDLNAQEFLDSIIELWEHVYITKQQAAGVNAADAAVDIEAYWKQPDNVRILSQGSETGDTLVEIARDYSVIKELDRRQLLPNTLRVIDFGPWKGSRRLKPLIEMLQNMGKHPVDTVGIDVADVGNDYWPGMDLKKMSFVDAAKDPALISKFNLAKSDWSATSDEYRLNMQLLNIAAYSHCLKNEGILILDTAFPEGPLENPQIYDHIMRLYHHYFPDKPEGMHAFKYQEGQTEAKEFLVLYYEVLIKTLEDAGFDILNFPRNTDDRTALLQQLCNGTLDIISHKTDAFVSPFWDSHGKPRITLVAKKVREPRQSGNVVFMTELAREFGPPGSRQTNT
jgi:hypothetical protein